MNFFIEHGIGSYEELAERRDSVLTASICAGESLQDTEWKITALPAWESGSTPTES